MLSLSSDRERCLCLYADSEYVGMKDAVGSCADEVLVNVGGEAGNGIAGICGATDCPKVGMDIQADAPTGARNGEGFENNEVVPPELVAALVAPLAMSASAAFTTAGSSSAQLSGDAIAGEMKIPCSLVDSSSSPNSSSSDSHTGTERVSSSRAQDCRYACPWMRLEPPARLLREEMEIVCACAVVFVYACEAELSVYVRNWPADVEAEREVVVAAEGPYESGGVRVGMRIAILGGAVRARTGRAGANMAGVLSSASYTSLSLGESGGSGRTSSNLPNNVRLCLSY